ncbi:hypothetical protein RHSIM_Rhsim04G0170100 [Rhododendron simsii]|uniref:AAA-type ATPase N-terminal domain-containing protein n=1 Tax=Rhododendron simsii TaxID=118357 RepID=A0A834GXZ9_RHOSS|nr:hypothetical protein RHSIM_Rhsim04G0170100 [Rhododendron simsii]
MDSIISMYNAAGFPFATLTIFVAFATFVATMKLIRSMTNDMLPSPAQSYLESALHYLITPTWNRITIVVNELHDDMINRNKVYDAAEAYLSTKISPHTKRLKVGKTPQQRSLNFSVDKGQEIPDRFDNDMELKWRLVSNESQNQNGHENRFFELSFNKKSKVDRVLNEYLPFVLARAKEIAYNAVGKIVKLYTRNCSFGNNESGSGGGGGAGWGSINLDHPATFETRGMDPELKDAIIGFRGLSSHMNPATRLDPALSCPGRVNMHIHMSYCSSQVFKLLASNYLGVHDRHALLGEIENLLENEHVTVDEVAEEFRKSENADIALRGVVNLLKRKKMEAQEIEQDKNRWTRRSVDGEK